MPAAYTFSKVVISAICNQFNGLIFAIYNTRKRIKQPKDKLLHCSSYQNGAQLIEKDYNINLRIHIS